ncbi:MAG TPA: hopanoid-associated sugar epimerase [Acidobacteriota bacterium]|nr:hopanoid-associated sugar epimerase [Acidobacteriota bacterium]
MKVLVTGASGFVGFHLVRRLLARGEEVVCLVRSTSRVTNLEALPVDLVQGDLVNAATLRPAVRGCKALFHCAADYRLWCPNPDIMYAANVEGTRNILQAAFDEAVPCVVYTSTVGCLGLNRDETPATETTPVQLTDMIGHYKRSKFLAEREAEKWVERGLPVVIVNPSTPVGDFDVKPTPTGKIIVDFLRGKMFGYVDTGMNLIDVSDVAEGHILAAEKGKRGEKYILGNLNMTLKEIFDALSRMSGIPSPTTRVPHGIAETYARVENLWSMIVRRDPEVPLESVKLSRHKMWFDSSKAVRELGLKLSPVEAALERAVQWFREHGYVAK